MQVVSILHILSGILIALSGAFQIFTKKGGKLHRIVGMSYVALWPITILTGAWMGSILITLFGALGLYMAFTGYRFGHLRTVDIGKFEKIIIYFGICLSLLTLGLSSYYLLSSNFRSIVGFVGLFFGLIFAITTIQDRKEFILGHITHPLKNHKMQWYFEHFTRMYISYIAAMTAFFVINQPFPLAILNWILPTVLGTILIIASRKMYMKKLKIC